jgi:hypothetical protein
MEIDPMDVHTLEDPKGPIWGEPQKKHVTVSAAQSHQPQNFQWFETCQWFSFFQSSEGLHPENREPIPLRKVFLLFLLHQNDKSIIKQIYTIFREAHHFLVRSNWGCCNLQADYDTHRQQKYTKILLHVAVFETQITVNTSSI